MPDKPFKADPRELKTHPRPAAMRLAQLEKEEAEINAAYRKQAAADFMVFTKGLRIASQGGPRVFTRCMAPFQLQFFEELAPNIEALRDGYKPQIRRWWVERTKKASKDADLAVIIAWVVAFPTRPFYGQVGAANGEQAGIVKERLSHLLHWNPWLNDHIEMINMEIRSKRRMANGKHMAKFDIMRSDIAGAHGGTPDLLIINELSHIQKWEFAENLMDNADGVAQGMVIVATNAGFKGTKAEVWRNTAITQDNWIAHVLARPAPWHDKATIEDARRRNPPSRFNRLWRGIWASGKGDALNEEDIEACFTLQGPTPEPEEGWLYLFGLDLGITHDHSALVGVGINEKTRKIKMVQLHAWEPEAATGEVNLMAVKNRVLAMYRLFRPMCVLYDPTEARLMAQDLKQQGVPMREMTFSSTSNLTAMAETLIQVVETRMLSCFDDIDGRMRRDFGKFNIVEKPYGYKLEAVSDEFGHADAGTALVITLPAAVALLEGRDSYRPDTVVAMADEPELEQEEIDAMPQELRDIFELDESDHPRTNRDW